MNKSKKTLESFAEFSKKELSKMDKLNVLEEEAIIGGKKKDYCEEKGTVSSGCIDAECVNTGEILWEEDV